jgi:hypothetical protein
MKCPDLIVEMSETSLALSLLVDGRLRCRAVLPRRQGFESLAEWLRRQGLGSVNARLRVADGGGNREALALAGYLGARGHVVGWEQASSRRRLQ